MLWQGKGFKFDLQKKTLVMGVLNVTPDSFSDGGQYLNPDQAVLHALEMERGGADIIDVGGESTRPGAQPVEMEEEAKRVLPVIQAIRRQSNILISIDTRKAGIARAAIEAGAEIVNDIGAVAAEEQMWEVVRETGAGYVMMHMRGEPETMQQEPEYGNVVAEVRDFFRNRLREMKRAGVEESQVALDVGIGFGKRVEHNLSLLRELDSFATLGRPLVLGVSRKSFIGKICEALPKERLAGSLACACLGVERGARVIRTHDVPETKQAVCMTEAVLGMR